MSGVTDVAPLAACGGLRELYADYCPGLADLRPLLSHTRRRLEDAFGEEIAQRIMVAGPRSHRFGDGQYGLTGLAPQEIVIV